MAEPNKITLGSFTDCTPTSRFHVELADSNGDGVFNPLDDTLLLNGKPATMEMVLDCYTAGCLSSGATITGRADFRGLLLFESCLDSYKRDESLRNLRRLISGSLPDLRVRFNDATLKCERPVSVEVAFLLISLKRMLDILVKYHATAKPSDTEKEDLKILSIRLGEIKSCEQYLPSLKIKAQELLETIKSILGE